LPRAYLGSFGDDDFGFVSDAGRESHAGNSFFEQFGGGIIGAVERLAGHNEPIGAAELAISDEFHRRKINERVSKASPAAMRLTRGLGTNAARTNTTKAAMRKARWSII
jgi:hypothetical protein